MTSPGARGRRAQMQFLAAATCVALVAWAGPPPKLLRARGRARPTATAVAAHDEAQWEGLLRHHEGFWKGVWVSTDATGQPVDEVEADSAWVLTPKGELIHVNTYFVGTVRANCDTCQDSVTARQVQVGTYAPGRMPGVRVAGPGVAFGPHVTKTGRLTCEVGARDGASRLRVVFAYSPECGPSGGLPGRLLLGRVTVIRESLDRPPLRWEPREQSDTRPSGPAADFWRSNDGAPLLGVWGGERWVYTGDAVAYETLAPTHLRTCRCAGAEVTDLDEHKNVDAEAFKTLHMPGGISVTCPSAIDPGVHTTVGFTWRADEQSDALIRAALDLTALGRVVAETADEVVASPPVCETFTVDRLVRKASGL